MTSDHDNPLTRGYACIKGLHYPELHHGPGRLRRSLARGVDGAHHDIASERDLIELLEADIGIAVIPLTSPIPSTLKRAAVDGLDVRRTVQLYSVAGR